MKLTAQAIERAAGAIDPVFLNTPVVRIEALDRALGAQVALKVETLTPIRSFKGRGADHLMRSVKKDAGAGVVCASAGNFGQGVAYAGRTHGIPVTVFAAVNANPLKLDAMRVLGAEVITTGKDLDDAKTACMAHGEETGKMFLNDGANVPGAAGAGTIARELTESGVRPDAVLAPLGNGALVNGLGAWLRAHSPDTRVFAVAADGAPSMELSWRAGKVVETESVNTIADGLAVRAPIESALELMRETTDDVLRVSDDAILGAMRLLFAHTGLAVEPSGAIGVGAMLENPELLAGRNVATVLCGGNVTRDQAREWLF